MLDQHELSEYIDQISFKKSFGMGFKPDEVYETICTLTSMYNEVLAESYRENDELRQELINQRQSAAVIADYRPVQPELPPVAEPISFQEETELPPIPSVMQDKPQEEPLNPKRLSRLSRGDLLEILITQSKENKDLKEQLALTTEQSEQLRRQLQDRRIKISKAGTLAEATFLLNGVLESAQQAAQQYLENLPEVAGREQEANAVSYGQATRQSQELLEQTRQRCAEMEAETRKKCELMELQARQNAEKSWNELTVRLEEFYKAHQGLRELLTSTGQLPRI